MKIGPEGDFANTDLTEIGKPDRLGDSAYIGVTLSRATLPRDPRRLVYPGPPPNPRTQTES